MNEPITAKQAERLLQAIFAKDETDPNELTSAELTDEDNYPETIAEKVSYSEYVLTHNLSNIGKALNRLSRLNRLLLVSEKHENGLPDIITNNELRMALEPLLRLRGDIVEITDILTEVYCETKQPKEE